jgi:uncharacterized repeat protein (TIGR01451 family)
MTIARHVKHASLALIALSSLGALQSAYAVGTPSGTSISNTATVNYSVGGVGQNPIAAAAVPFVVDARIDLTVTEVSGNATPTTPGQNDVAAVFTVTNTGNSTQGYALSVANEVGGALFGQTDNQDVANLRIFVDSNNNGIYEPLLDTATNINSLVTDADGESRTVFVLANIPLAAANNEFANVRLTARAAVPGTNGATLATETAGADNPAVEDVVFADAARDATESALDQYAITSATLNVTKTSAVISDPFNLTTNPKAIPGATVEYTIALNNTGAQGAVSVIVSDNIPANTTYLANSITLNAVSVSDAIAFSAGPPAAVNVTVGAVAAGGSATVTFRVTIN